MCIHFNYLWKSWRIINSRENCEMRSSGPWRESASSNRYGLILSSKMICSFYYSKQLWSAVCTHIFASYLLARIAMLEIIVCCILALCLVCTKKRHSLGGSTQDEYAFIFGQFAEPPERVRERNRIISRRRSLCFLNSNQGSEQKSAFVRMLNLACEHKEFGGSRLWKQY